MARRFVKVNQRTIGREMLRKSPQAAIDLVLHYSHYVALSDRSLLQNIICKGVPVSSMARAAGMYPRTMHRRVRQLLNRMTTPAFRYVVRNQQDWPQDRKAIAQMVILHGETMRAAARTLHLPIHLVRSEVARIRAQADLVMSSSKQRAA
jgi:AraC-like DNA-binding protein